MICELFDGIQVGNQTVLSCSTGAAYHLASAAAALTITVCLARLIVQIASPHFGKARWGRLRPLQVVAIAVLMTLSAAALAFAASQPVLVHAPNDAGGYLAVVVDVSDSVTRDPHIFDTARNQLADAIEKLRDKVRSVDGGTWSGSVISFGAGARVAVKDLPLDGLARAVRRLSPSGVSVHDSNAAAGLALAQGQLGGAGVPGLVLLVSDGHWLSGDVERQIVRLQRAGVPVFVIPVGSSGPARGIIAANMAASSEPGSLTIARLVVRPGSEGEQTEVMARTDSAEEANLAAKLPRGHSAVPVRVETRLSGRGLRHVELSIRRGKKIEQRRRLFTLLKAPPRVLVFGPAPWLELLGKAKIEAVRGDPSDPPMAPEQYDVIIVDGEPPRAFPAGYPELLAQAVAGAGRGLLIINGPGDRNFAAETVLALWEKTSLGPLLPVSTDMRQVVVDPPPRDIALIFDTSGSMDGWPLSAAKRSALGVVDQLRPIDRLSVIPFGVTSLMMDKVPATEAGKKRASNLIRSFTAAGGSDAAAALGAVTGFSNNSCAVFFFTDGAITGTGQKPGCETVVLELTDTGGANTDLGRLGQVVQVWRGDENRRLKIDYLEPEIREEHWRAGLFRPLAIDKKSQLTPGLPVDGIAVSYPRPQADRISVHPDAPPDPVLAMRNDLRGVVAAFLGDLSTAWGRTQEGRDTIEKLVNRLSGWNDVDRYQFEVVDRGDALDLSVLALHRPGLNVPARLEVTLSLSGAPAAGIPMKSVDGAPGSFTGTLSLPPTKTASHGALFVRETGGNRIADPQRIPVRLPGRITLDEASMGGEAWQFGVNRDALRSIAARTGGALFEDSLYFQAFTGGLLPRREEISALILALSAICFILGLWIGGERK